MSKERAFFVVSFVHMVIYIELALHSLHSFKQLAISRNHETTTFDGSSFNQSIEE